MCRYFPSANGDGGFGPGVYEKKVDVPSTGAPVRQGFLGRVWGHMAGESPIDLFVNQEAGLFCVYLAMFWACFLTQ